MNSNYTIILGAEGELGKALAREVADRGSNLILVSTSSEDLQRFAIGLQLSKEVEVEALKLDITSKHVVHQFSNRIRENYEIRALINNITCDWSLDKPGCGSFSSEEAFIGRFRGAALITWNLLPQLVDQSVAYIQHVIPFPFRKNQFTPEMENSVNKLCTFARELEDELKKTSVIVSVVHPAPVNVDKKEFILRDELDLLSVMTPRRIARVALNGMLRGSRLIIPGFRNTIVYYLVKYISSAFSYTAKEKALLKETLADTGEKSLQPS